jgi:hypothetical protein
MAPEQVSAEHLVTGMRYDLNMRFARLLLT